jgi:FO synthase
VRPAAAAKNTALALLCIERATERAPTPRAAGDKPEELYPEAAAELAAMGYASTLDYVAAAAGAVLAVTGLLPHINAGAMGAADMARCGWGGGLGRAAGCGRRPVAPCSPLRSLFSPRPAPSLTPAPRAPRLKEVSVSQGLMLETLSPRLTAPGGPHHGCPDKEAAPRLGALVAAGEAAVPFTTGLLGGWRRGGGGGV